MVNRKTTQRKPSAMETQILELAGARKEQGVTSYEIVERFGHKLQTVSARLFRMKAAGKLVELREASVDKDGQPISVKVKRTSAAAGAECAVLVLPEYAPAESEVR